MNRCPWIQGRRGVRCQGGHGRALVDAAETLAREWGCACLEVMSGFRLENAYGFYERTGFAHNAQRFVKAALPPRR